MLAIESKPASNAWLSRPATQELETDLLNMASLLCPGQTLPPARQGSGMPNPYGVFHGSPADAQLLMTLCLVVCGANGAPDP